MDLQGEVADELARAVLELVDQTGDESIVDDVKKVIGTSSTTLEEAYMTAVRVRRAETRALALIEQRRKSLAVREG